MTQIDADQKACLRVRKHGTRIIVLVCLMGLLCGCGRSVGQARPVVEHVIIVSIDGLRPDMMLRNNTPVMRSLMRGGSYTMWARTTEVSITLPSHVSMLTGVVPERHAIWWNIEILAGWVCTGGAGGAGGAEDHRGASAAIVFYSFSGCGRGRAWERVGIAAAGEGGGAMRSGAGDGDGGAAEGGD